MPPTIQEVKAKHEQRLLAMPGVVSVGIGRDPAGNLAIIVGLVRHHPKTVEQLPKLVDGYPIKVEVIGPVRAL